MEVRCIDCKHVYTWEYGQASTGIACFHPDNIRYDDEGYKHSIVPYWSKNDLGQCKDYERKWWKVWK